MTMLLEPILTLVLIASLVVGPLTWRALTDRRQARALAVRADVHRAVTRALGGESFVTVEAKAPGLTSRGRVVIGAPADWKWLIEAAWPAIIRQVPRRWDLVVRLDPPARVSTPLERAA
ncbi:MAG: hypothetical protein ACRELS_02400 [Candidatus Rokuibacteriota bacterium]